MDNKKRSFFERLTGGMSMKEEEEEQDLKKDFARPGNRGEEKKLGSSSWIEEEDDEAELAIDVYQTSEYVVVQTMVAGVRPEDLDITIGRSVITIRGKREGNKTLDKNDYDIEELYWGKFRRDISPLPAEVEPEEAEATERHGLLTLKVKKVDKEKKNNLKVKSV